MIDRVYGMVAFKFHFYLWRMAGWLCNLFPLVYIDTIPLARWHCVNDILSSKRRRSRIRHLVTLAMPSSLLASIKIPSYLQSTIH